MYLGPDLSLIANDVKARLNESDARSRYLASLTPYEREHLRQVEDHERQYREKNAARSAGDFSPRAPAPVSRASAGNECDPLLAGAVGLGLGAIVF